MLECESDVFIQNITQKLEMEILCSSKTFFTPISSYFRILKKTCYCKMGQFQILIINVLSDMHAVFFGNIVHYFSSRSSLIYVLFGAVSFLHPLKKELPH